MSSTVGWEPEAVWMVVRQRPEYLKPIDFRTASVRGWHGSRQRSATAPFTGWPREIRSESSQNRALSSRRRGPSSSVRVASERRSAIGAGQVGTTGLT